MKRREFIATLGLIGCSGERINPKEMKSNIFTVFMGPSFNLSQHMDLINIHSVNSSQFSLTGSSIDSWNDGISSWTSSGTARPTLTGGIPIFDGGDNLYRSASVTATTFSLYIIFKNTGALQTSVIGSLSTNTYILHRSTEDIIMGVPAGFKATMKPGFGYGATATRYSILAIRKNGNTVVASVNDRPLYITSQSFSGETMTFDKLMGSFFGSFTMTGGLKSVCMSSQYLDDTIHTKVINKLYSDYSMSSDNTAMTVFGFGDSNTAGVGSTSYLVGLASTMGLHGCNLGISGSRASAYDATSGAVTYPRLISRPYSDYISIQYGTNDLVTGVSTSTYRAALNTIVGSIISAGHPASKICLSTPPYQLGGINATGLNNYRTEVLGCATNYGTKYFDLLQDIRDNGGDTLMYDTLHLNDSGQTRWKNGVYTAFTS